MRRLPLVLGLFVLTFAWAAPASAEVSGLTSLQTGELSGGIPVLTGVESDDCDVTGDRLTLAGKATELDHDYGLAVASSRPMGAISYDCDTAVFVCWSTSHSRPG